MLLEIKMICNIGEKLEKRYERTPSGTLKFTLSDGRFCS